MITLVKAVETCMACPAQWDAWDTDGQYYYLRYRHGKGTVERFASPDTSTWGGLYPPPDALVASFDTGDDGGVSTLQEFCENAGIKLSADLDLKEMTYDDYDG